MKRMYSLLLVGAILSCSCASAFAKKAPPSNLPVSQQASFIETYSPSEVMIQATGMGLKDKDALFDIRKCAVNFVLKLGTDPVLNTPAAKALFDGIAETFFAPGKVDKYISWEADRVVSAVRGKTMDGRDGMKITKMVRVNKKLLKDDLTAQGIITSQAELTDAVGMPTIMVIPEVSKGQTPIAVLEKDPLARQGAAVIESFLTAKQYDVVVPRAVDQLNEMTKLQGEIKATEEDASYELALALGSDIYIVYALTSADKRVSVQVRAYETTTGRLLGTETGYSAARPVPPEALVEEAINSAIENVLQRITNYWQDDMKKGIQYKLVIKSLSGDIDDDVKDKISDLIDDDFALSKENIVSSKTLDYNVWAKKADYNKSRKIARHIRDAMKSTAKISEININKKLIILGVEPL
jgi:hypothetical protein